MLTAMTSLPITTTTLDGTHNFRDLGGLPLSDGGTTRPGVFFRSEALNTLTAEGEAQLATLLERHPDLSVEAPDLPGIEPAWRTDNGALRLRPDFWPGLGGMDGFFIARLDRV